MTTEEKTALARIIVDAHNSILNALSGYAAAFSGGGELTQQSQEASNEAREDMLDACVSFVLPNCSDEEREAAKKAIGKT